MPSYSRCRQLVLASLGRLSSDCGAEGFNLDLSFKILFAIIIMAVGSISGAFLGSAFIVLLPVSGRGGSGCLFRHPAPSDPSNMQLMVFGGLIVFS